MPESDEPLANGGRDELDRQAYDLAISTPYGRASIERLQRGLMTRDPAEYGKALTAAETAVPVLLNLDMALGGRAGVGRALRMLKRPRRSPMHKKRRREDQGR